VGSTIDQLLQIILTGGAESLIPLLLLAIILLIYERMRLVKKVDEQSRRIDRMVEDYYRSHISLTEALTSLRIVLYEIKSKF
jgi:hypothetical protein